MDVKLLEDKLNEFGCHPCRQKEVRALFIACCYLSKPPYIIRALKISNVSLSKEGVCFKWSSIVAVVPKENVLGLELFNYVECRLKKSNGRNFYLFLKASKNTSWFRNACIRWLGVKQSFFKECNKVPFYFLPSKDRLKAMFDF